jgi:acetyl-CoA carboxylase biotin carboxyl carrier protein
MSENITAPLAGKIVQVQIEAGARVEEDDEAFVIEAMKMETPVYVPVTGTVASIAVAPGDEVEEEDLLAVIDA